MELKHILLIALAALALSLASIGTTAPSIAGSKPSVMPGNALAGSKVTDSDF